MTLDRAHLIAPAQDTTGNVIDDCLVRLLVPGTTSLINETIYASATGNTEVEQPFTVPTGVIDVYLPVALRVRLGITPPGQSEFFVEDVDVEPSGPQTVVADSGLHISNAPAGVGQVLTSTDSSTAEWADPPAGTGGGGSGSNLPDVSEGTLPDGNKYLSTTLSLIAAGDGTSDASYLSLVDSSGAVWYVGVDTSGHLTTTDVNPFPADAVPFEVAVQSAGNNTSDVTLTAHPSQVGTMYIIATAWGGNASQPTMSATVDGSSAGNPSYLDDQSNGGDVAVHIRFWAFTGYSAGARTVSIQSNDALLSAVAVYTVGSAHDLVDDQSGSAVLTSNTDINPALVIAAAISSGGSEIISQVASDISYNDGTSCSEIGSLEQSSSTTLTATTAAGNNHALLVLTVEPGASGGGGGAN